MIRLVLFVLALLVFAAPAGIAHAEDAATETGKQEEPKKDEAAKEDQAKEADKKAEAPEEKIPEGVKAHQKAAEEVFEMTKEIAEKISPEEQKHFFLLYNNYNLIGTVKMVQDDVSNAVESCGKENPDLKKDLDTRFKEWNEAVNPVMKDAEASVENMIVAQSYAKPAQIRKIFKGLDKTRKLANNQIEKTPVTTKDACEYLLGKMSDTQANFVRLLQSTLMSVPQVIPSTQDAEPAAGDAGDNDKKDKTEKSETKPAEDASEADE